MFIRNGFLAAALIAAASRAGGIDVAAQGDDPLGVDEFAFPVEKKKSAGPTKKAHRSGQALANVSRSHPDFGCTVEEHEARKAARKAEIFARGAE